MLASEVRADARDWRAALVPLLAIADSLPGDRLAPLARERAGDAYLALGDARAARAQFEECLARYPQGVERGRGAPAARTPAQGAPVGAPERRIACPLLAVRARLAGPRPRRASGPSAEPWPRSRSFRSCCSAC